MKKIIRDEFRKSKRVARVKKLSSFKSPGEELRDFILAKIGPFTEEYPRQKSIPDKIIDAKNQLNNLEVMYLPIGDLFKYKTKEKIHFTGYLYDDSQAKLKLNSIIDSKVRNQLIIAPMGSGKSTSIIRIGLDRKLKIIIAVPLVVNVEQFYQENKESGHIVKVRKQSNTTLSKILLDDKTTIVICIYDSVERITSLLKSSSQRYILVMDEAHNLVSQSTFRQLPLRSLIHSSYKYLKFILLTGTPEVLISPLRKRFDPKLEITEFIKKDYEFRKGTLKLLKSNHEDTQLLLLSLLKNRNALSNCGLTIITEENVKKLEELKLLLIQHNLSTEDEIYMLDSSKKETLPYAELVRNEIIPDGIKFLLTTSVISDGCNLKNKNVVEFYSLNWTDLTKLRQIQSRLRHADDKLIYYDLSSHISYKNPETSSTIQENFADIKKVFNARHSVSELICYGISELIHPSWFANNYKSINKGGDVYSVNESFYVDYFYLFQDICFNNIYNECLHNSRLRFNFIKDLFNFDANKIEMNWTVKINQENRDEFVQSIVEIRKKEFSDLLNALYENVDSVYSKLKTFQATRYMKTNKNLMKDNDYKYFIKPMNNLVITWYKELMDLNIPTDKCNKIFEYLTDILINQEIQNNVSNKIASSSFMEIKNIIDKIKHIQIYKAIKDETRVIYQDDIISLIEAISMNKNKRDYLVWNEITNGNTFQLKDVKRVANSLFELKEIKSGDVRKQTIKRIKSIADILLESNIRLPTKDIKYFS